MRVVITGMGAFCGSGNNITDFWHNLCAEKSAIKSITQVDCTSLRFQNGAEVENYTPSLYFDNKQLTLLDRFSQFALLAAREAVSDSGMLSSQLQQPFTAIVTGTAMGGKASEDRAFYQLYHEKKKRANPTIIPNAMANAGASHIAQTYGITGPAYTISTACASSTHAIGQAYWLIRHGIAKQAITGGSEAPFSLGQLKAWEGMRVIASDTCRAFSKNRSGMILGEGGGMLVLESLKSAKQRDAKIYAEIVGFGMSSDAMHLICPGSAGQQIALHAALKNAKISPQSIQYINAHGTGTVLNDTVETETIHNVFGAHTDKLQISSTKGAHGHLLGATGAIETIATALAIHTQRVPPTLNFLGHDPDCNLPICTRTTESPIQYALTSSFAFGGLNAALVLKRFQ